jgi:signal transduction histidine kinase
VQLTAPGRARWWWIAAAEVVLVLLTAVDALTNQLAGWNRPYVLTVATIVAVALRRVHPGAALALGIGAYGWAQATLGPVVLVAWFAYRTRRDAVVVLGTALAVLVSTWPVWDPSPGLLQANLASALRVLLVLGGAAALGRLARVRGQLRAQNQQLLASRARERRVAEAAAAAAERTRMAREMHDVVSHQISLLAVQAGALRVSSSAPEVTAAAETLRSLAVRANDELRRVLKVLRADGTTGTGPGTDPPTLPDLAALCRRPDLDVELSVTGDAAAVPDAVQRAAYRIVQEGLTNAAKHATGREVVVDVLCRPDQVSCAITSPLDPTAQPGTAQPGTAQLSTGHGLLGVAERVAMVGGTWSAGPADGPVWVLRADLQVRAPAR